MKVLLGVLLAVIAISGGLVVIALVAAVAALGLIVRWARRRFFGKPAPTARVQARTHDHVIDVTATEVPATHLTDGTAGTREP